MKAQALFSTHQKVSLGHLLAGLAMVDPIWDREITGLTLDSRQVKPGDLFMAYLGDRSDARLFIPQAIEKGALAIVAEGTAFSVPENRKNIPLFFIEGLKQKLGIIASRFYRHPSRQMDIIGVTGTNGKTSCTHSIAQALTTRQKPCAVIGTVGYGLLGKLQPSFMTTPDAVTVQKLLADYRKAGIETVSMEMSSHALEQGRVNCVEVNTAIFTNLTREHLDYHKTMESYGQAKQKLFEHSFNLRTAILNQDDPFSLILRQVIPASVQVLTYGLHQRADIYVQAASFFREGLQATITTPWGTAVLKSSLLGQFNLSNLLALVACLGSMGFDLPTIIERIAKVTPVLGRMQVFQKEKSPLVVVDYAHTPDALEQVLKALSQHLKGRLYCVFGCGGNRDPGKRAVMGSIAEQYADCIVLTNDNPRDEDPQHIVNAIRSGVGSKVQLLIELDRKKALEIALASAGTDDIILLAGKGHEIYQDIGGQCIAQTDQALVLSCLKML